MNKRIITGIIVLMTLSLAGIIVVQFFWIKHAVEVKEAQFDQAVSDVLSGVVKQLETDENVYYITQQVWTGEDGFTVEYISYSDTSKNDNIFIGEESGKLKQIEVNADENGIIRVNSEMNNILAISQIEDEETRFETIIKLDSLKQSLSDEKYHIISKIEDSVNIIIRNKLTYYQNRNENLEEAIDKMVLDIQQIDEPIESQLTREQVNNRISEHLIDKAIVLPFEFAIYQPDTDSLYSIKSDHFLLEDISSSYKTRLFPDNIFNKPELLLLNLPDKKTHIFKSLSLLLSGSGLFTIIILVTFFITIRIILKQKKLSEIKSDFINNMTHEFKTPIATISLAIDSINNSKVIHEPERIKHFTGIIEEENKRMNARVENVLQMSLIDKQDFAFRYEMVDIFEVIQKVVKQFELQIQQQEGKIQFDLNVPESSFETDADHLTTILTYLIDNALKYSKNNPEIIISTENANGMFKIKIKDNGIGMTKEEKHKIFDKFYRVPKGDIHNVKGFGLGLSYVKAVVLAMGGKIDIESTPGVGSEFIISIPINHM